MVVLARVRPRRQGKVRLRPAQRKSALAAAAIAIVSAALTAAAATVATALAAAAVATDDHDSRQTGQCL